jgi:hypothetical protein
MAHFHDVIMPEPEKPQSPAVPAVPTTGSAPVPASPAEPAAAPAKGDASVFLKGEIEIFTGNRLPHLDQGPNKAYAALTRTREKAFALICERNLVPQIFATSKYYGLSHPSMPKLVGAGVVDWDPIQQQRYVFVYENKIGLPIATKENQNGMGLKNDMVVNRVMRSLIPAIKDLRDADFVHGNIRIQNLYDGGVAGFDKIFLGECLSTPPGFLQPVLYETIDRGAAHPLGRGLPTYEDDMYALGVTLAVMLRSNDPMAGFSDDQIVAQKIEEGSYAAITGKERFTGSLLECLRGLLNDDPRQRWSIDDVITWMEGRRVHARQGINVRLKASRPIEFDTKKYLRPQLLAFDLPKNTKEAVKLVEGKDLFQWLNRSLQDKPTEERSETAVANAQEGGTGGFYPDRLASYVATALSPTMPVMYRDLRFMPEGFGRMLAEACMSRRDLNPYIEYIQNQMILFYSGAQESGASENSDLVTRFENCRAFLRHAMNGYGIERCIYNLCPEVSCLSDKLKNFYVRSAEDLLLAYNALATTAGRPENLMDRHIIAFLSVRDRQIIDPYIPDLNSDQKYRHILGILRVFNAIQLRSKMEPVPGLTSWLAECVDPLINRLHDRELRTKTRAQLQKVKDKGDISKILALFDNAQIFQDDFRRYREALQNFANLRGEHARLQASLETDKTFGHGTGRQVAAMVSGILAGFAIIFYLLYQFSGGGTF